MRKGDIILIPFPFTDLSGVKHRPAVVLINSELDVTVAFTTSKVHWQDQYDILLQPTHQNGLKKESIIRLNKIATIDNKIVIGKLGELDDKEIQVLNSRLKMMLKL